MAVVIESKIEANVGKSLNDILDRIEKLTKEKIEIPFDDKSAKRATAEEKKKLKLRKEQQKLILEELDLLRELAVEQSKGHKESVKMTHELLSGVEKKKELLREIQDEENRGNQENVKYLKNQLQFQEESMAIRKKERNLISETEKATLKTISIEDSHLKKKEEHSAKIIKLETKIINLEEKGYIKSTSMAKELVENYKAGLSVRKDSLALLDQQIKKESLIRAPKEKIADPVREEVQARKELERLKLLLHSNGLAKRYKKTMSVLDKEHKLELKKVKALSKEIGKVVAQSRGEKALFAEEFTSFMVFREITQFLKAEMGTIIAFEDNLYQMGIVGGKTTEEIRGLRDEMHDLGSVIPRTTNEIVSQITSIERTGRSYKEALGIMTGASKLAIASGESLSDSVSITNTTLKAFDISVLNSAEALDSLHSATLKTPLDLNKISSAMKNAGASMRNFIESTSKSGKDLENYKQKVLDLSLSLVGGQVSLGRTANSAGVSLRMLGTKLINLENSSARVFNAQMQLNNAMHEGEKVTATYLSTLAQEDLPKAVELLSKLYTNGQLSIQTLTKMFTSKLFALHRRNSMSKVA